MQEILIIDNFDSFTWNLVHYLERLDCRVTVVRNNEIPCQDLKAYDKIILSPGPGTPAEAGGLMQVFEHVESRVPVLGVCLGMQAMAMYLGGQINNKTTIHHGEEDMIIVHNNTVLFQGLHNELQVGLYHSWEVDDRGDYLIDSRSATDGTIMAISNPSKKFFGVQFHPESIMTPQGIEILKNFLNFTTK